jgi:hypothetical protein
LSCGPMRKTKKVTGAAKSDLCGAWDNANRCRRVAKRRYRGSAPYCQMHYMRAYRNGGETRHWREVASIKAKKRLAKLAEWRKGLLSGKSED